MAKEIKIQIFGSGCAKCKQLEENVKKAIEESKAKASIEKITDIGKIIDAGIMETPALAINGKIVCTGKVPSVEEINKLLSSLKGTI
ncbi:MAG: thioredoxin family protein [Candidatus Diapherotrites archaeon]